MFDALFGKVRLGNTCKIRKELMLVKVELTRTFTSISGIADANGEKEREFTSVS